VLGVGRKNLGRGEGRQAISFIGREGSIEKERGAVQLPQGGLFYSKRKPSRAGGLELRGRKGSFRDVLDHHKARGEAEAEGEGKGE